MNIEPTLIDEGYQLFFYFLNLKTGDESDRFIKYFYGKRMSVLQYQTYHKINTHTNVTQVNLTQKPSDTLIILLFTPLIITKPPLIYTTPMLLIMPSQNLLFKFYS